MNLTESQRKYLVHEQIIGAAVINGVINALLAWLTFRKHASVPMHGDPSILGDALGTALLLPLLLCLIATPLIRKAVRAGKVAPISLQSPRRTMLLWLPRTSFVRGLVLAVGALATCAPVMLGALTLFGVQGMSVTGFVVLKLFYAGIMAALVSPIVALYVLVSEAAEPLPFPVAVPGE